MSQEYQAQVDRIVDGDTLDLTVALGFGVQAQVRVRIAGVDAPEVFGEKKSSAEFKAGKAAAAFVDDMIPPGSDVTIRPGKSAGYGQWAAEVLTEDGTSVGDALLEAGHATPASW